MRRISFGNKIRADLVVALRVASVRSGRDIREIVEEALEAHLDKRDLAEGRSIAERQEASESRKPRAPRRPARAVGA
jgi:hypothetical protein